MLNTPIPRLIPGWPPSIAGMMVTSAYNLADTLFVSQLGTYATGAVGVNASIDNIIMMAGSLLATGAASYTSRLLGAGEDKHARQVLSSSYFVALILGVLVLVFGTIFQRPILLLLGANEVILPYSQDYCRYVLLAAPFMSTSFVLNQCLRAEGSAIYSMIGMVAGAVLNIGLDPLFIFVFDWGVAGLRRHRLVQAGVLGHSHASLRTEKDASAHPAPVFPPKLAGGPGGIHYGQRQFFPKRAKHSGSHRTQPLAITYGESALAAISVANRITMFMTSACLACQGFQPVAGFCWAPNGTTVCGKGTGFLCGPVLRISVFAGWWPYWPNPCCCCLPRRTRSWCASACSPCECNAWPCRSTGTPL